MIPSFLKKMIKIEYFSYLVLERVRVSLSAFGYVLSGSCRCFRFGADGILARGVGFAPNVEVARQTLEKSAALRRRHRLCRGARSGGGRDGRSFDCNSSSVHIAACKPATKDVVRALA